MLSASKLKKCKVCKAQFKPCNSLQIVCGFECASKYPKYKRHQDQVAGWKKDARAHRKREREAKGIGAGDGGPARNAQRWFNAFIRIRDADKPCIVHGWDCPNDEFDAGHFLSRGSHPMHRFNCWNVHKQCSSSNRGAHTYKYYKGTVGQLFEANLIKRIGRERVAELRRNTKPKQYKVEDFQRIARIFKKRTELYKRLREQGNVRHKNRDAV